MSALLIYNIRRWKMITEEVRKKISEGLKRAHAEGRLRSDFGGKQGWRKGLTRLTDSRISALGINRFNEFEVFTTKSKFTTRRIKCYILANDIIIACCGHKEWKGQVLVKELHHNDGDKTNNTKENLKFICPNCHSITKNYKFKGRIPWNKKAV
jgi:hypothetical protein